MATKKTQQNSDLSQDLPGSEADLDQAIDDLRGVLKQDADGDLSQFGGDLQSDPFAAGTDLAAFGGETSKPPLAATISAATSAAAMPARLPAWISAAAPPSRRRRPRSAAL